MPLNSKEILIENYLKSKLPNVIFNKLTYGNGNSYPDHIQYQIGSNRDLIDSKYFYKSQKEFIHFTTFDVAKSIISNCHFRMYNLYNMNDPREYTFANREFYELIKNKEDPKINLFLLSMCKPILFSEDSGIEFNMWRLYADDGKGIGLKVSFDKTNSYKWEDYYLSQIYYGIEERNVLSDTYKFISRNSLPSPKTEINFSQIACFHKPKFYHLENEVRLLADYREFKVQGSSYYSTDERERIFPLINEDTEKRIATNLPVRFLELPIYSKVYPHAVKEYTKIPYPTIKEIIIGHKHKSNYKEIELEFQNLCMRHLGYLPIIKMSRISKWFV
ncbi:MAG: DUF2971 domain-containing protein [Bacteroidetes bacterium]|nr:DUF2971 domain-containing protein [Bacteroidota bacterium]